MNNYRMTTAKNLQQVINDHMVAVIEVQTEDKETDEVKEITPEQFQKDLEIMSIRASSPNRWISSTKSPAHWT